MFLRDDALFKQFEIIEVPSKGRPFAFHILQNHTKAITILRDTAIFDYCFELVCLCPKHQSVDQVPSIVKAHYDIPDVSFIACSEVADRIQQAVPFFSDLFQKSFESISGLDENQM